MEVLVELFLRHVRKLVHSLLHVRILLIVPHNLFEIPLERFKPVEQLVFGGVGPAMTDHEVHERLVMRVLHTGTKEKLVVAGAGGGAEGEKGGEGEGGDRQEEDADLSL
eukprot:CAMPEP_0202960882 /NCGR_PEP_ID=MMETSP1396-20130829/5025_1 /ASSEMBLY_ACC=CAM_ASM_000872 /TAXON_ID= /ORGANISM="Pseudokeronopsis sp., Strain Brazil" /LENGTH=108 /DNA_ID=CAMNT_0049680391 /DNA_START=801 /DNA_END=1127 /DNA_ORIENTATION=+